MTEDKSKSLAIHQNDSLVRVERSIALTNKLLSTIDDNTVTDIDGNVYKTVKIGDQVWMAENLKVTHYRNGDKLASGLTFKEFNKLKETKYSNEVSADVKDKVWGNFKDGAYCHYDDDLVNTEIYGNLYNWYAVDDSRGIAPEGWHVPTDNDWIDLEEYLGMDLQEYFELSFRGTNEGSQLAGNADLWRTEESYLGRPQDEYIIKYNTTFGSSGFFALPGGKRKRQNMGNILKWDDGLGTTACFWTSSDCNDDRALNRSIKIFSSLIYRDEDRKWRGLSIRCIKD